MTAEIERLRAIHVVAGLAPEAGGPSYSVPRLCRTLANMGASVELQTLAPDEAPIARPATAIFQIVRHRQDLTHVPVAGALRLSASLARALASAARTADIVHSHGLWLAPNLYAARAAGRRRRPHVISPRGMLGPAALQFSRLKKQAAWRLAQGGAVRAAACLHATSDLERQDVRAFGLTNPVAIIPNGVDIPDLEPLQPAAGRTVLSLGRIHPKKGLDRLVRAWAAIEADHPEWRLRIVGPPELGHELELRELTRGLGLQRVSVEGPIYGDEVLAAYRDAELFVLPTLNENFAMTVAEALAAGTPVISTKGAPWAGLEIEGCGWWIDHGVEALAATLGEALALPRDALRAMGGRGRAWVARDFSWDRVAIDMLDLYRWLAKGGDRPGTVRLD